MISYQGKHRRTVNYLRTIQFDRPEWTICAVSLMPATWIRYREALEDLVLAHPRLFPGFHQGQADFDRVGIMYELGRKVDCWGCGWNNVTRGLDSYIEVHPLQDWAAFDTWQPPDPLQDAFFAEKRDWQAVARSLQAARQRGDLATGGGLQHGFLYMLLFYLRGFENLMLDLASDDPRLHRLIELINRYNETVVNQYLELGAEMMSFGEDLGTQKALPISPAMWRKFIKPGYQRVMGPCRDRGVPVYLHSDGHILEIIPDLVELGVRVLNPQIRANGLPGLVQVAKGRVAINLDLDRQLFPFASAAQIQDHIHQAYQALWMPEGGLMLHAECEPDVPLESIDLICSTLEQVCSPPQPVGPPFAGLD